MSAWRGAAAVVWAPTAGEMSDLDRRAVAAGHTSERVLIEAAGREVAARIASIAPEGPVCGLIGSGHNGADALVALRTLAAWGRTVRAVQAGSGAPEPEVRAGWPIELEPAGALRERPPRGGVVLDGLLGTGVRGAPRAPQATLINAANGLGLPIVSIDVPSGADATTGAVPGACIRADVTVCLGWPKLGLFRHPARSHAGRIEAVEIGFPPIDAAEGGTDAAELAGGAGAIAPAADPGARLITARLITARWVQELLRSRPADAHKSTSGYVLLVAGTEGMAGAAVLAARAAYRSGAGIVRVIGHPANREIIQQSVPGAIFASWGEEGDDRQGGAASAVEAGVEWAHALAIGPGLGRGPEARSMVERLLAERGGRPVVLDADGLNAFAGEPERLAALVGEADVITPHPGELDRLLDVDSAADPPGAARAAAERFGCVVVLKGAPTVVASHGAPLRVAVTGGPAMAVGGTGDVLTGAIGAALAAGYGATDASTVALLLTGLAAERARPGGIGLVAEDIPDAIPAIREEVAGLGPRPSGPLFFVLDSTAEARS
ncbi:MAG: NAD(P)H-hydrate dehydratase [Gemmatimonadota bacterium]